jgi:hypothetical protein
MYSLEDGKLAVKIARETIERHVRNEKIPKFDIPPKFKAKSGVFVTINRYPSHELRGCIGYPEPTFPLIDALIDSAKSAATRDPRFTPVESGELEHLVIEVSLLTPPQLIQVNKVTEYLEKINIGEDGLIIERGLNRGLLLPQVPVEWGWDTEEFLAHTCMKAGLTPDCWLQKHVKIYKFSAKIYTEKEPRGAIEEKVLTSKKC